MESCEKIECKEIDDEILDEKPNCYQDTSESIDDVDNHHASNNIHHNHPTFFSSYSELSTKNNNNNNKNTTMTSPSSDHQKECNNDFHSVLSYLCHTSPSFSLQSSGLEKALRLRSLSFPSVFVDEEMHRSFNDIVLGQEIVPELQHLRDDVSCDVGAAETDHHVRIDLKSPNNNDTEANDEWKTIPIHREPNPNIHEYTIDTSIDVVDNAQPLRCLDYFEDDNFHTKMKEILYTHHGSLIDPEGLEKLPCTEHNINENLVDDSKTIMTGQIMTSQHNNTEDIEDKKSFNHLHRETLSYADDNFVELTQAFHSPRFVFQNDYYKDENFVRQMKNLWKHYHHNLDDSSVNTSPSRQSLSTSRTTNTLSPTQSSSSLASAFSQTYSANSTASGGIDSLMRHDLEAHYFRHHHVRSKHFLNDKTRKTPKRGHTISNIIYDSTAFEKIAQVNDKSDQCKIGSIRNSEIEEDEESDKLEVKDFSEQLLIKNATASQITLNNTAEDTSEQAVDLGKKKKRPKNRIRSATSGAFNYMKKKKSSKSVEEETNVVSSMLSEENDCDTLGDDGIVQNVMNYLLSFLIYFYCYVCYCFILHMFS